VRGAVAAQEQAAEKQATGHKPQATATSGEPRAAGDAGFQGRRWIRG
jgi:hypothetical protein